MNCPRCSSIDVKCRGRRNALYPLGILAVVGIPFAMLHQASSPYEYQCNGCGLELTRRTTVGKTAGIILLVLVVGLTVLFAIVAFAIITRRIS
jgi:hypothetical protein